MPVREILLLGNPVLRARCLPVRAFGSQSLGPLEADLRDTLDDFRNRRGFGRGIAAPQIGAAERMIFIHVQEPLVLINPNITRRSRTLMTLWDDCFSLPDLLVKVRRHLSIEVRYRDLKGRKHILKAREGLSELLQHEIDHLDGILAIDRAVDSRHIVLRSEFDKWGTDQGRTKLSY